MNVKNCPQCGKIFVSQFAEVCNICQKEQEAEFARVKDYLYENPGAIVQEVSDATEVPTEKIFRYLREGRLTLSANNSNFMLNCENCDKQILTGRYCDSCKSKLTDDLSKHLRDSDRKRLGLGDSKNSKMFTAERRRR